MAKLNGILGSGSGKLGNAVMRTVAGEQILAQYQPNVSNPNTQKQVNQRARMKLMSQVSAALAPVIAIPREGLKSSRNLFAKKNFDYVNAASGIAQVTYENLQLTNGSAGLPAIVAKRATDTGVVVGLESSAAGAVDRVCFILYVKSSEGKLQYIDSIISEDAGDNGKFQTTFPYTAGDLVLYAYGMKDLNASASARYGNYEVSDGTDIAKLIMARSLSASDYQLTETRGTTMFSNVNEVIGLPANKVRVWTTVQGYGSTMGSGTYDKGASVTVHASPGTQTRFVGWKVNGEQSYISTDANYTFTANSSVDLIAVFVDKNAPSKVTITTQAVGYTSASLTGGGEYNPGDSVTLTAPVAPTDYEFEGWKLSTASTYATTERTYTFTASANATYQAVYTSDGMQI